jgi:hypothetical protein
VAGRIWEETRDIALPGTPVVRATWQAEERRKSLLGLHVLQVADYANGGYSTTKEEAERAMKQIQRTLFGNPLGTGFTPPDDFHKTALGKLFDQAYWRMLGRKGLLTPDEAIKELGISSRTTLYSRIYQRKLHPVYGSQGEMMLRRSEIDAWKKQRKAGRQKDSDAR